MKKNTLVKALAVSGVFVVSPSESANAINNISSDNFIKEGELLNIHQPNALFIKEKLARNISKNTTQDTVKEVTLAEGQYVPDLSGNTDGYTTIKVITTGDKKLEEIDYYNLKNSGIANIDLSGAKADSIPSNAFYEASHIESFVFPIGITSIEDRAFWKCSGLTGDLVIPDTVTTLGYGAFAYCSGLNGTLEISDTLSIIEEFTFYECTGFTGNLIIPDSVLEIKSGAFYGCIGFTGDLTIGDSVKIIENNAFSYCSGFTGNLTIGNSVETIGDFAFQYCTGFSGNLTLGSSLKTIGQSAFICCESFTGSLVIPNSVESIGAKAFYGCASFNGNLTLSDSLTEISLATFYGCIGFTGDLTIPDSVVTIGENAFSYCSGFTGNLIIGDSVETIGDFAFQNCIGFSGTLRLGNSIKIIGNSAFVNCSKLTGDLIIPDSVITIGVEAFYGCAGFNGNLVIGSNVITISERAFYLCSGLSGTLTLGNSLQTIGDSAFFYCYNLTGDLIIPNSVTNIGVEAFYGCAKFNGNLVISNSITTIPKHAFYGCIGLTGELIIPTSVTSIGYCAFGYCRSFTGELVIPNSVTIIDDYAFFDCSGITGNIFITKYITTIGIHIFANMPNVENIIVGVDTNFEDSNYRKNIIDALYLTYTSTGGQFNNLIIDIPYDFDIENTWLKDILTVVKKPIINKKEYSTVITIPTIYSESKIEVLKDGQAYSLPTINQHSEYVFTEEGLYQITITTDSGITSVINFEVGVPLKVSDIIYENGMITINKQLSNEITKIEYRVDGGEWVEYTGPFILDYTAENVNFEVRVTLNGDENNTYTVNTDITLAVPTLNASDVVLKKGETFNKLDGVTAIDVDGTEISKIKVTSNINTNVSGNYLVTYQVTGKNGAVVEKTINVRVLYDIEIHASNKTIYIGEDFKELEGITATDGYGNSITDLITVVKNDVNTNEAGTYEVIYQVVVDGETITKTIYVTVAEKEVSDTPEQPEIPESPEAPEQPETPEAPEVPEIPEAPEVPDTPDNGDSDGNDSDNDDNIDDEGNMDGDDNTDNDNSTDNEDNNKPGTDNPGEGNTPDSDETPEGDNNDNSTGTDEPEIDNKPDEDSKPEGDNSDSNSNPSFTIKLDDITINVGDDLNPLKGLQILDSNGVDITSKVQAKLISGSADTSKAGVYRLTYEFTYDGNVATKDITVTVKEPNTNTGSNTESNDGSNNNNSSNEGVTDNSSNSTEKPSTSDTSLVSHMGLLIASSVGLITNRRKKSK